MRRLMLLLTMTFIGSFILTPAVSAAPLPFKPAVVNRVIDTYTLEVTSERTIEQVRLLNLAPPQQVRSTDLRKIEEMAADRDLTQLTGKTVFLEFDDQVRDAENRLLAYVWLKKPKTGGIDEMISQMLNAKMILLGYAEWYPLTPNYKYTGELLSMETDAYFAKRGIWDK